MTTIKLQKFLASAGIASRRASEELIEQGKVKVNSKKAHIGQRIDPKKDKILFQGKPISNPDLKYYLVNKPVGVVTTTADELDRGNVLSLLPVDITKKYRLYPVGRLDKDSEGLILLTNDGAFTHHLTHPSHLISKTYRVLIERKPSYRAIEHLKRGVLLREGITQPAKVSVDEHVEEGTWLTMTIKEGRNRQIRRMLERVGYETVRLIRTHFGPYTLEELGEEKWVEVEKK